MLQIVARPILYRFFAPAGLLAAFSVARFFCLGNRLVALVGAILGAPVESNARVIAFRKTRAPATSCGEGGTTQCTSSAKLAGSSSQR